MEKGSQVVKRAGPKVKNAKRSTCLESRQCLNSIEGVRCSEESRSAFCRNRRCRREWYYLNDNIAKAVAQANKDPKCTEKTWDHMYELVKASQQKSAEIDSNTYLQDAILEVEKLANIAGDGNIIEKLDNAMGKL